jgi:diaminopimelate decarboxylase/aspartate kinase
LPVATNIAGRSRPASPLTLDNLYVLRHWGEMFRGRSVFIRIDTGTGRGHHHHVRTAGAHTKFGVPLAGDRGAAQLVERHGAIVVGLHAHSGSGIFNAENWSEVATCLLDLVPQFPQVRVVDVGGGLGVPDGHDHPANWIWLARYGAAGRKQEPARVALWIEPGRYLVAESGVLIARVTQTKSKDEIRYVGIATGMNSLIRPGALRRLARDRQSHAPG